jgi:hypothetical protein
MASSCGNASCGNASCGDALAGAHGNALAFACGDVLACACGDAVVGGDAAACGKAAAWDDAGSSPPTCVYGDALACGNAAAWSDGHSDGCGNRSAFACGVAVIRRYSPVCGSSPAFACGSAAASACGSSPTSACGNAATSAFGHRPAPSPAITHPPGWRCRLRGRAPGRRGLARVGWPAPAEVGSMAPAQADPASLAERCPTTLVDVFCLGSRRNSACARVCGSAAIQRTSPIRSDGVKQLFGSRAGSRRLKENGLGTVLTTSSYCLLGSCFVGFIRRLRAARGQAVRFSTVKVVPLLLLM